MGGGARKGEGRLGLAAQPWHAGCVTVDTAPSYLVIRAGLFVPVSTMAVVPVNSCASHFPSPLPLPRHTHLPSLSFLLSRLGPRTSSLLKSRRPACCSRDSGAPLWLLQVSRLDHPGLVKTTPMLTSPDDAQPCLLPSPRKTKKPPTASPRSFLPVATSPLPSPCPTMATPTSSSPCAPTSTTRGPPSASEATT